MIIEILTPLMLATSPVTFEPAAPSVYDHSVQRVIPSEPHVQTTQYRTYTASGTQTYAYNGRPNDSDNDTD